MKFVQSNKSIWLNSETLIVQILKVTFRVILSEPENLIIEILQQIRSKNCKNCRITYVLSVTYIYISIKLNYSQRYKPYL